MHLTKLLLQAIINRTKGATLKCSFNKSGQVFIFVLVLFFSVKAPDGANKLVLIIKMKFLFVRHVALFLILYLLVSSCREKL